MNRKSIDTMAGSIEIKGVFASWKLTVEQRTPIPDTELIRLRLEKAADIFSQSPDSGAGI